MITQLSISIILSTITVTSPDFHGGKLIPEKYSCDGENISPGLTLTNIPKETISLALIMDDPDAPDGDFVHWLLYNIEPGGSIAENSSPGIEGVNSKGKTGYTGPCQPSGTHHYHFKIYALDTRLNLKEGADKSSVLEGMKDHIIATGEIIGLYEQTKLTK